MADTRLLVTTGPESSGKTTLANALARTLALPLVPERSRPYLERYLAADPRWRYREQDLLAIALEQRAAERDAAALAATLVCDTDLLVIRIWSEEKYGRVHPALARLVEHSFADDRLYLLCSPDMPWEPDPLRENPEDRWRLFDRYLDTLEHLALPHLVLTGDHETRLRTVLQLPGVPPVLPGAFPSP